MATATTGRRKDCALTEPLINDVSVIKTAMRQGQDVVERLTRLFRGIDPQSTPT